MPAPDDEVKRERDHQKPRDHEENNGRDFLLTRFLPVVTLAGLTGEAFGMPFVELAELRFRQRTFRYLQKAGRNSTCPFKASISCMARIRSSLTPFGRHRSCENDSGFTNRR